MREASLPLIPRRIFIGASLSLGAAAARPAFAAEASGLTIACRPI